MVEVAGDNRCPTLTKTRHGHEATIAIHRIFCVCGRILGISMKPINRTTVKSQLSNAEYHLTKKQIYKIIAAARCLRDWLIVKMLAETGLRRGEITALNIEDINLKERRLLVRQGKGNKSRLVPLTTTLPKYLKAYISDRTAGPLFSSRGNKPLSARQVNRIVIDAGKRAGIANPNPKYSGITPHLFRHSFARLWKDKGGSIEALSKIMGHQSTATTWDLYGTMSLTDIDREFRKVMKVNISNHKT